MVGRLEGKVAIITGGSRGIGKATAELFASEGANVFVNYNTSEKNASSTVRQINEKRRSQAFALKVDVSKEEEVKKMVASVVQKLGTGDVLVNNAGILRHASLDTVDDGEPEAMVGTHVRGTIYCTREVARIMVKKHYGKIVNLASIAAVGTALPGTTPYSATKAAVASLTRRE